MRVALVHELLTMRGGAEGILRVLAKMFPEAPITTLLYDEAKLGDWFQRDRVRTPTYPTPYSLLTTHFPNHHLYLRHFPRAVESFDFSAFDLVISTSSAFVHGIITNSQPKHLCYVNSPARYLWDRTHDVLERAGRGPFGPLRRLYLERTFHTLRIWDAEVAPRPDAYLAASKEVQRRIELYWREKSDVLYPPIDDYWLRPPAAAESRGSPLQEQHYFLIVSTLVPYKRVELAIEACKALNVPLKIVGEGPHRGHLERMAAKYAPRLHGRAGPMIEFLGYQSFDELRTLYERADATIFPGEEDFGIVPLESMACGTPVIAFGKGGALETVLPNETGTFFPEPTATSLIDTLRTFNRSSFDPAACRRQAETFSRARFERGVRDAITKLLS